MSILQNIMRGSGQILGFQTFREQLQEYAGSVVWYDVSRYIAMVSNTQIVCYGRLYYLVWKGRMYLGSMVR